MNNLLIILLPAIILTAGACLVLLLGLFRARNLLKTLPILTIATIFAALFALLRWQFNLHFDEQLISSDKSVYLTSFSIVTGALTLIVGLLLVLLNWNPDAPWLAGKLPQNLNTIAGESFAMMLFSLAGILLVTVANNLILLALAIELVSFPTYVLVSISRPQLAAREAGLKYFFLGALATALLFFGFAWLYGVTGQFEFAALKSSLAQMPNKLLALIFLFIILGLAFKIAAAPMHFYAPDVYQGASSSVTALLAFAPKLAGFYALLQIINLLGWPLSDQPVGSLTANLLWILAAATMTIGNTVALFQRNAKRILAYSSIAHSGYIMLALLAGSVRATAHSAILFYLIAYAVATLGAFGVLALLRYRDDEVQTLAQLTGLARRHPGLAAILAICIFSLIGMPLTAGFVSKYYVFWALLSDTSVPGNLWLLLIALLNAAVASAYYLRIIAACYLADGEFIGEARPGATCEKLSLYLAGAITVVLGIYPRLLTTIIHSCFPK